MLSLNDTLPAKLTQRCARDEPLEAAAAAAADANCRAFETDPLLLLLPATLAADVDQVPGELAGRRVVEIELLGYRHTRVHVIQRELRTRVGQPLSPATPAADLQRLGNLDIFSSVRVQLVAEGAEAVRVTYHLRELAAGSTLCHLRRHRSGWLVLWTRSEVGEPLRA